MGRVVRREVHRWDGDSFDRGDYLSQHAGINMQICYAARVCRSAVAPGQDIMWALVGRPVGCAIRCKSVKMTLSERVYDNHGSLKHNQPVQPPRTIQLMTLAVVSIMTTYIPHEHACLCRWTAYTRVPLIVRDAHT